MGSKYTITFWIGTWVTKEYEKLRAWVETIWYSHYEVNKTTIIYDRSDSTAVTKSIKTKNTCNPYDQR